MIPGKLTQLVRADTLIYHVGHNKALFCQNRQPVNNRFVGYPDLTAYLYRRELSPVVFDQEQKQFLFLTFQIGQASAYLLFAGTLCIAIPPAPLRWLLPLRRICNSVWRVTFS